LFRKIKKALVRQKIAVENQDKKLTEFTHQILNRIMFLYFIQKRGCFDGNKNFMADFWDTYKSKFKGKNKFHTDWLNTLFFEALCNPPWLYKEKNYLGMFNEVLKNAPYLNGGLFERNDLDNTGWAIPDSLFDDIFEFFESFNFTVEESTPLDIDIAINPEMLGNIYEHLVNIEERQEQKGAGIFYTPKAEIELMIRRALVEFLYTKTGIKKDNIYYFIFEEDIEIRNLFNRYEAEKILHELDGIFILDPACGSGHYLIVAVKILYSLKEKLRKYLKKEHLGKYEEKKKIIERNIYGNDIKEWAVEIAKLRLWLELFVDAEWDKLQSYSEPILPNLKFKIRVGDSLIQRIGNQLVPLRKVKSIIQHRRDDLKYLIKKKHYVYESGSIKEYSQTINWEKKILQNALTEMEIRLSQKLHNLKVKQQRLGREWSSEREYTKKQYKVITEIENELREVKRFKNELNKLKEPPMIWDLAFAEVFAKKNGFDIVIANPPYVRHEKIEDFTGFYSKKEYKDKLIEQTIKDWSYDYEGKLRFRPGSSTHPITGNFPQKSDLYVYFYLKGLKLLNPNGILCFISSNSWLDVGFGAKMQEILLKNVPIIAIYDSVKRSFAQADINTIIALMKTPKTKEHKKEIEDNVVRFVMFKKPYEEIMDAKIFIDIEKNVNLISLIEGKMRKTENYRLHLATHKELLEYGKNEKGEYEGNKWGGKYLRAPEIYWRILEKGKGKLIRLGDIAEMKRGFTTGANEFFYLPSKYFDIKEERKYYKLIPKLNDLPDNIKIEKEFLKPVIISINRISSINIRNEEVSLALLIPPKIKNIKSYKVWNYIKWGETKKYHIRPTTISRKKWYVLLTPTSSPFKIAISYFYTNRYLAIKGNDNTFANKELFEIYVSENYVDPLVAFLNSTFLPLWFEVNSISNIPSIVKIRAYDLPKIPVISNINLVNKNKLSK
jgi:type I restriction-modification system DNA methylase subunit